MSIIFVRISKYVIDFIRYFVCNEEMKHIILPTQVHIFHTRRIRSCYLGSRSYVDLTLVDNSNSMASRAPYYAFIIYCSFFILEQISSNQCYTTSFNVICIYGFQHAMLKTILMLLLILIWNRFSNKWSYSILIHDHIMI